MRGLGGRRGVSQEECDELGMTEAQRLACKRAIDGLGVAPDVAVIDGKWNFVSPIVRKVEMRVKADRDCLSVAAASILAKVVARPRDARARRHFPHWSFDTNKGYPVPGPQGGAPGLRALGDPPPHVDLHGPLRPLDRHPACLPPRAAHPVLTSDLFGLGMSVDRSGFAVRRTGRVRLRLFQRLGEVGDQVGPACSMPTDSRIRSAGTSSGEPAAEACVIAPGCSIRLSTAPSDSAKREQLGGRRDAPCRLPRRRAP